MTNVGEAVPAKGFLPMMAGGLSVLFKFLFGYGSSLVMGAAIYWQVVLRDDQFVTDPVAILANWGTWCDFYIVLQLLLVLTVTGGRNVGKDILALLDILLSLVPVAFTAIIIYGWFDNATAHPLSSLDWRILQKTIPVLMIDCVLIAWAGMRISRLMGEMHVSNLPQGR